MLYIIPHTPPKNCVDNNTIATQVINILLSALLRVFERKQKGNAAVPFLFPNRSDNNYNN